MSSQVVNLTDSNFDEEISKAEKPILVDFWAPWCGPCKAMGPILEQLAEECAGKATVVKVNVDDNQKTAAKFGVRSIPTLIAFKAGEEKERFVGMKTKEALKEALEKLL